MVSVKYTSLLFVPVLSMVTVKYTSLLFVPVLSMVTVKYTSLLLIPVLSMVSVVHICPIYVIFSNCVIYLVHEDVFLSTMVLFAFR